MTMLDDPVVGQSIHAAAIAPPAPSSPPPAAASQPAVDPVAGQQAPAGAIDPVAGQAAPLAVRGPVTPDEYRQRVSDPDTTYTVHHRTGFFWGLNDTDTPMTFQQLYENTVPVEDKQRIQIAQNVAIRARKNGDPSAGNLQFQADRLMHDVTKQNVQQYDPTAFPEDEAELRSQIAQRYQNMPLTGQAVTALDQGVEGVGHNFSQAFGLENAANVMQGLTPNQANSKRITDQIRQQIESQVNPFTSTLSRVGGNILAPENLITGEAAAGAAPAVEAATGSALLGHAATQGIQGAVQSASLAGTEDRAPTAGEIATNTIGGFVAGAAGRAVSNALPFAQRAAESAVAGDLPSYVLNKAGDLTSSSVASASGMVATNAAAAAAQGRDYSRQDAVRDFEMGIALEPLGRLHASATEAARGGEAPGPIAQFRDEPTARKFVADNPNTTYAPMQGHDGSTVHAVVPAADGERTPERVQESADQVARAEQAFRRQTGDAGLQLTPVEAPGVGDFGRMLGDRLGLKVHWYQSNRPMEAGTPSAAYLGDGHVAVDVGADGGARDPVADIPHEFVHDLRRTSPEIYSDLAGLAQSVAPNRLAQVRQEYADRYADSMGRQLSPDIANEEGVADFIKSMMTTPQKWNYLVQRQPTFADKLGAFVRDKLGVAPAVEPRDQRVETAGSRLTDLVRGEPDSVQNRTAPQAAPAAVPSSDVRPGADVTENRTESPGVPDTVTNPPIPGTNPPIGGTQAPSGETSAPVAEPLKDIPNGIPTGATTPSGETPSPKRWTVDRIEKAITRAYENETDDRGNSEDVVLHPDQLKNLSPREKAQVSKYADEDEWTNRTASLSVRQSDTFSRNMLVRALGNSNRGHFDDARAWAREHPDPAIQFMAWMHENRAGTKKELIDLTSPEKVEEMLGKSFTINKEPFQLHVDEHGMVHLVDSDIAFAGADRIGDGHLPIDAGSEHDLIGAGTGKKRNDGGIQNEDLPFSLFRKNQDDGRDTQLSLAGEREGRETMGGTRPMFGTQQPEVTKLSYSRNSINPAALEKFSISSADVDAARAYSDGEPSPAFAYGSQRARTGLGMKAVPGMTGTEAREAHTGWKATKEGMSDISRQVAENPTGLKPAELAERNRIQSNQVGDTGALFSLADGRKGVAMTGRELGDDAADVPIGELRRRSYLLAKDRLAGTTVRVESDGKDVLIPAKGLQHSVSGARGREDFLALPAVDRLLKNATLVDESPDRQGRQEIRRVFTYESPLRIGDNDYTARMTVRETNEGTRFYDQTVLNPTNKKGSAGTSGESSRQADPLLYPATAEPSPSTIDNPPSEIKSKDEPLLSLASKEEVEKLPAVARFAAATRSMIRDVRDGMNLDPVPRLSRLGGGDEAASHAFARPAATYIVKDLLAKVFPEQYHDPIAMTRTWEALNDDRKLGLYDDFKARAEAKRSEAEALQAQPTTVKGINDEQIKNLLRSADEYRDKANAIDLKHGVAKMEAGWQQAMKDPTIAANVARWNEHGATFMDQLYNEGKGLDPDAPQSPRGRHSAGVSLVSTDHDLFDFGNGELGAGEPDPKQPAGGTMRNAKVSKDRWDQSANGLGDYDTNPETVLSKIVGSRWNQVTKLRLFDQLQKSGLGVINDVPPHVTEDGARVQYRRLDITQPKTEENGFTRMVPKTMWVRPEVYREVRDVLNTDLAPPSSPVFRALTRLQLLQVADAVTHTKNLHSVLASALGGETAFRDLARRVPGLATADTVQEWVRTWREMSQDTPKIREEMAGMAKAGLLRPDFPATGIQKITKMQDFLHAADTAGRVIMNRRFDNLVARGIAEDTPGNRRNYVGQLGNYNRRLMNPMARIFKDLGLSPFVTAGTTMNRQSRRLLAGSPGFEATSTGAALRARATLLGGTALAISVLPAIINSATTGSPLGRSGTPFGAIDTGMDDDKGNHRIFDYLQLMGIRRGMRSLGIDAIANGLIQGKDWNTIGGQAVEDVSQAALHPWIGPGVGFAAAALTGRRLDTRGKMEAEKIPEGGMRQDVENLRAALASQNPLLYAAGRAAVSGANKIAGGAGDGQSTGADLADVAGTLLKSPLGAAGIKAVRPGTDAAQDMAARLNASHYPDAGPTDAGGTKAAAVKRLSEALRAGDEGAMDKVHAAIAAGTISEKDVPRIVDRSGMTDLEWKVSHMSGAEAAKVYAAGTDQEKSEMRDAVIARIAKDNTLSSEDRMRLLHNLGGDEAGVGAGEAEAKMVSELSDLRAADRAGKALKQRIDAVSRQIGQASASGNGGQAQQLRQQRQSLVKAARGQHVNGGRLKRLSAVAGRVSKIRKQVAAGSLSKSAGGKKIRQTFAAMGS